MPEKRTAKSTLLRLSAYLKGKRAYLAAAVLCALIYCALDIFLPYYMGHAVDFIVGEGNVRFHKLIRLVALMGALNLVMVVFYRYMSYLAGVVSARAVADIRKEAFGRLSRMPLSYYDSHSHGDIVSRFVNDCEAIHDGLSQAMVQFFSGVVTVAGCLIFMMLISVPITFVVILVTALTFVVGRAVAMACNKYFGRQQKLVGEITGITEEIVSGIRTAKLYGCESWAQEQFDRVNRELYVDGQKAQFASSLVNPTTRFVGHIAFISVGVIGGTLGGLSAGGIASFIFYSNRFSKPFGEMTAVTTQILAALAAAGRIFDLMDMPVEEEKEDLKELRVTEGAVEFRDVNFSYEEGKPLITDFNAAIKSGQRVAVVGPTGAGKTTLVNLIMRFYETDGGEILIDGQDVSGVTKESLRNAFGMVLQDTWLFDGTVAENVAYGCPDASREEIVAAARAAYCHSFIMRLKDGYDTVLTDSQGSLSAGQRQLLTIARVMLKNPSMLILDEATSSVDILTEQRIQRAFQKLIRGKTSFVIAHRLSTIRDADLILVMRDGAVVEQGDHGELLKKGGFYRELYYKSLE